MSNGLVYLAGPITGESWQESTEWRNGATRQLADHNIIGLSPLRAKHFLSQEQELRHTYDTHPLSTQKGLTTRDRFDCKRADIVLVNLIGADKVSIGTVIELGWASAYDRPIVLAMEDEGNLHDHPMVREVAGYRVPLLSMAIELCINILHPAGGVWPVQELEVGYR